MKRPDFRRRVTLQDIADHLGLARGTVSMALRGDPRIAAATVEKVLKTAADLGYDPGVNQAARRMSLSRHGVTVRNHVVGVIAGSGFREANYFQQQFLGVFEALSAARIGALLVDTGSGAHGDPAELQQRLTPLTRGEIDGLLSIGPPDTLEMVDQLRHRAGFGNRPTVVLLSEHSRLASVLVDEDPGTYAAAKALISLGHRHFLRLGHRTDWSAVNDVEPPGRRVRRAATLRALAEAGFAPAEYCHTFMIGGGRLNPATARRRWAAETQDDDDRELLDYLQRHPEITAIMANNDSLAISAWAALRRAGISVPGRYSLIGFDDTDPVYGDHHRNLLSSIAIPLRDVGREGVRLLLQQIDGNLKPATGVRLPTSFAPRASIGPASRYY